MSTLNLAVIPGDGIGPEVTSVALQALEKALDGLAIETTEFDLGANRYLANGEILTDADLASLRSLGARSTFEAALRF